MASPGRGRLSPQVTDEGAVRLNTPHPALRATFPPRGEGFLSGTADFIFPIYFFIMSPQYSCTSGSFFLRSKNMVGIRYTTTDIRREAS